MKICVVSWLKGKPVPPKGYGGIERMVGVMCDEFIKRGHDVLLIAPEGSNIHLADHIYTNDFDKAYSFIQFVDADIVWENSCWVGASPVRRNLNIPCASVSHVNHAVGWHKNVIYLSESQKRSHEEQLGLRNLPNPVIYVPVDPQLQPRHLERGDYLLFLGAVTPWKGVKEAAELTRRLGRKLYVAGPAWGEYADQVKTFSNVEMIGEVDGERKNDLIEQAYAVCCLHNSGGINWKEPGCGVVMEAGAFNTPVFALNNGCLNELVLTGVNGWFGNTIDELIDAHHHYPNITTSKEYTDATFDVGKIGDQYMNYFEKVINEHN